MHIIKFNAKKHYLSSSVRKLQANNKDKIPNIFKQQNMTHQKFIELYDKYQPWFGKAIEIFTASSTLDEQLYKKYLLMDIKGVMTKEDGGREDVSVTSVVTKDLETSQVYTFPLETFDQAVRLINLGGATNLKLSNTNKSGQLTVNKSLGHIEFFIIQINSHFGKTPLEWTKVADNIVISFNSKRTNHNLISIPEKLFLSSLITNQEQPVFNLAKTYPIVQQNFNSQSDYYDTIEITLDELSPINEDYEVTFIYEKKP